MNSTAPSNKRLWSRAFAWAKVTNAPRESKVPDQEPEPTCQGLEPTDVPEREQEKKVR